MAGNEITIPYKFTPRDYQLELLQAIDSGYRWAIAVWSRRAGKDKTLWNIIVKKAMERVGTYYYFFPTFTQGRRVIWDGIDNGGMAFRDHIPKELIYSQNSNEMKIVLRHPEDSERSGSIIQIIGTDDYDRVRGSNPVGCVFSEYAWQNPMAFDTVRPILNANNGWALFNSTPFGENHFYKLWKLALDNPNWFTQMVTVETAKDESGNPYITEDMIQADRDLGYSEEMIQQEYYCSFKANTGGFYYRKQLNEAESPEDGSESRITSVPYEETVPVHTWWDLGIGDETAIWFTQTVGREIHIIDYYANSGEGLAHYAKVVKEKPYIYERHHLPHDARARELGTGKSRFEMLEELLGTNLEIVPMLSVEDGIQAARSIFRQCWFDKNKCIKGLDALANYHREWDERRKTFKNTPTHDWSSHGSDAFRYFAVGYTSPRRNRSRKEDYLKRLRRLGNKNWMAG